MSDDKLGEFANHPKSISELRSEREEDMTLWLPRDVLVSLLRQIDSGELNIESLVVCFRHKVGEDFYTSNSKAAPTIQHAIGIVEICKAKILADFMGLS